MCSKMAARGGMVAFGSLSGAVICASLPAHGAEFTAAPTIALSTDYVENPRLALHTNETHRGSVAEISTRMTARNDLWRWQVTPRLRSTRYDDDDGLLDSDDRFIDAALERRTERGNWSVTSGLTRDTTLTSELDTTGYVQTNRPHRGLTIGASGNWLATERLTFGINMQRQDHRYDDADWTGLVDYTYDAAGVFVSTPLGSNSLLKLTAQAGELDAPGRRMTSQNASARLAYQVQPHPHLQMSFSAGPAFVETQRASDDGAVYGFDAKYQRERLACNVSLERDLTPTGRGVLARRNQVSVSFNYRWRENFSTGLSLRGIQNKDVFAAFGAGAQEVRYARAEARADWQATRRWRIWLSLSGATQRYEADGTEADSARASVGLVWTGQTVQL